MPLTYAGPLPPQADVVVIGGGVIGVCTALYLARAGQKVCLIEKGRIAAEQSSRNWGWIRQQGRDAAEMPIMQEAHHLWHALAGETNVDIGLRQRGIAYLGRTEADVARYEAWLPTGQAAGLDSRILSAGEVANAFPDMAFAAKAALVTPSDLQAEPWVAVPALAAIAVREGAVLVENCAARMLDMEGGVVAGVVTEQGRIRAPRVVLAGGAWSALFLRNHGVEMPQLSVRENVAATQALPDMGLPAGATAKVAFRRRADGGYTLAPPGAPELFVGPDALRGFRHYLPQLRSNPLGQRLLPAAPKGFPDAWRTPRRWQGDEVTPFERMRVLDPAPNKRKITRLVRDFQTLFPKLGRVRLKSSWAGMIDTMPDIVPVVDSCAALPGLVIGTGMSGHGFGIGPGMGKVLAALATGAPVEHDLARFRLARFSDGSAMIPGPNV